MSAQTMAEVLSDHAVSSTELFGLGGECFCGARLRWSFPTIHSRTNAFAAHQSDMLTAAGFGHIETAKADAWAEGFKQGGPMHDVHYDDPDAHTRNPYRKAQS